MSKWNEDDVKRIEALAKVILRHNYGRDAKPSDYDSDYNLDCLPLAERLYDLMLGWTRDTE